jgi:hypothetical protein
MWLSMSLAIATLDIPVTRNEPHIKLIFGVGNIVTTW